MKEKPEKGQDEPGEDALVKEMVSLNISLAETEKGKEGVVENESEATVQGAREEVEKMVESVKVLALSDAKGDVASSTDEDNEDTDEDETHYTSKGPILQRRVFMAHRTNPYQVQQGQPENGRASNLLDILTNDERVKQTGSFNLASGSPRQGQCNIAMVGQFVDEPNLLANVLIVAHQGSFAEERDEQRIGIPVLPDMTRMTKSSSASMSRIIVRGRANPDGTRNAIVLPTPLAPSVDLKLRKIGVWLPQHSLPAQAMAMVANDRLEILIQLDMKVPRLIRHVAMVAQGEVTSHIVSQFVELRPFVSFTGKVAGIEALLEGIEDGEIDDAVSLVNGKDLTDLLKTYGPNEDSMLMTLCCKKDESTVIRAQAFALVSRILSQKDPEWRSNIVQKNACHLSALDYTTVTNNRRIACFLADLYYVMGQDVSCPDSSGNTLLHMMARKGDVSAPTLEALLGLRFASDVQKKAYLSGAHNNKLYWPIHFAAMSRRCPHLIIRLLQMDMPNCMTATTDNGSAPIHLACQYTSDPAMIATLLYYNREVVNRSRTDGFTPLHLVASRNDAMDRHIGLIPLDEETQVRMVRVLLEHGADKNIKVEQKYLPFDLVKAERERARGLLKIRRREPVGGGVGTVQLGKRGLAAAVNPIANSTNGRMMSSPLGSVSSSNSVNACLSPTPSLQLSPASIASQMSPPCSHVLGSSDPFIGGNSYVESLAGSPNSLTTPRTSSGLGYSRGPLAGGSDYLSDGGSNSDGGEADLLNNLGEADLPAISDMGDGELDLIARTFYNHPTIQAVMNGAGTAQSDP